MKDTRWQNRLLVLTLTLGVSLAGAGPALAQSDRNQAGHKQFAKADPGEMKSGRITAKSNDSVTIDGRAYALHPNVVFSDSLGGKMRWDDFAVNSSVRFHLTKDGKVDQLVASDSPG